MHKFEQQCMTLEFASCFICTGPAANCRETLQARGDLAPVQWLFSRANSICAINHATGLMFVGACKLHLENLRLLWRLTEPGWICLPAIRIAKNPETVLSYPIFTSALQRFRAAVREANLAHRLSLARDPETPRKGTNLEAQRYQAVLAAKTAFFNAVAPAVEHRLEFGSAERFLREYIDGEPEL